MEENNDTETKYEEDLTTCFSSKPTIKNNSLIPETILSEVFPLFSILMMMKLAVFQIQYIIDNSLNNQMSSTHMSCQHEHNQTSLQSSPRLIITNFDRIIS